MAPAVNCISSRPYPELGPGWVVEVFPRKGGGPGGRLPRYKVYVAPDGTRYKSHVKAQAAANGQCDDLYGRVAANPIRNMFCVWCGGNSGPGNCVLLCDTPGCNQAWHLACLEEPLDRVPEGNWFCPYCEDAADMARGPRSHQLDAATLYARCELAVAGKCPDLDGVRWRLATPDELPSGTALGMLGEPLPGQPRNAPVLLVPAPLPSPADASARSPWHAVSASSASALQQRRFTAEELAQLLEV